MDRFSNWTINTGYCAYHEPAVPRERDPLQAMIETACRDGVCHVAPGGQYLWYAGSGSKLRTAG